MQYKTIGAEKCLNYNSHISFYPLEYKLAGQKHAGFFVSVGFPRWGC